MRKAMSKAPMAKVFRVNDAEWYVAFTVEQAVAEHLKEFDSPIVAPRELTSAEMQNMKYNETDEDEKVVRTMSFAQHLKELIQNGDPIPALFAFDSGKIL